MADTDFKIRFDRCFNRHWFVLGNEGEANRPCFECRAADFERALREIESRWPSTQNHNAGDYERGYAEATADHAKTARMALAAAGIKTPDAFYPHTATCRARLGLGCNCGV